MEWFIKGVRPILTLVIVISFVGVMGYAFLQGIIDFDSYKSVMTPIVMLVLTFWFVERTTSKAADKAIKAAQAAQGKAIV